MFSLVAAALLAPSTPAGADTKNNLFTASNYQVGAENVQYSWSLQTATSGNRTGLRLPVPVGTSGKSKYLVLSGTNNNGASTTAEVPDLSTNIDMRASVRLNNWNSGALQVVLCRQNFALGVSAAGELQFLYYDTGGNLIVVTSSAATGYAPKTDHWIRTTFQADNGSGSNVASFYTSADGTNWSLLGTPQVTAGIAVISPAASANAVLGTVDGTYSNMSGRIYYADARSLSSTTVSASDCAQASEILCFDPSTALALPASANRITSRTGETWEITQDTSNAYMDRADIASELPVLSVTNLPSGGIADIREIAKSINYTFPVTTAIGYQVDIAITIGGVNNTIVPTTFVSEPSLRTPAYVDGGFAPSVTFSEVPSTMNTVSVSAAPSTPGVSSSYTFTGSNINTSAAIGCVAMILSVNPDGTGVPNGVSFGVGGPGNASSTWTPDATSWVRRGYTAPGFTVLRTFTPGSPTQSASRTLIFDNVLNPATAGTYFATVQSYATTNCTTPIDTAVVAFSINNGIAMSAVITPQVTFSVSSRAASCNGETVTSGTSASATAVNLGHLSQGTSAFAAVDLHVVTNAASGFTVNGRSSGPLTSGGNSLPDAGGTNANPAALPATTSAFAYTTSDSTLLGGTANRFTSSAAKWAAFTSTSAPVMSDVGPVDATECMAFAVQVKNDIVAATYVTTVTYTVIPTF